MLIRLASPADALAVNAIYRPYVTDSVISFELEPPTDLHMAARIADTLQQYPWLVGYSGNRVLGYAYAGRYSARPAYQWSVETSVYVDINKRRQGVGRALYQMLLVVLQRQGYFSIYAGISLPNPASIALHQAMGFTHIGTYCGAGFKLGAWHDVGWWQKPLCSYETPAGPPKPISSLIELHPRLDLHDQCA